MMPNALNSLYGEGHVNATRLRECVAMPGVRNQVVLTPQTVVDGLRALWPEGVAYDAAGCPLDGYLVGADVVTSTRGLADPWPHRTYCNPPYGQSLFDPPTQRDLLEQEIRIREAAKELGKTPKYPGGRPLVKAGLKDWLAMQLAQGHGGLRDESVLLCPNRTNRKWLRHWRSQVTHLVELDPLKFVGHKQAFPAPLVLGFMGPTYREEAFFSAFSHLGDPVL